jgi:hypothetical protein
MNPPITAPVCVADWAAWRSTSTVSRVRSTSHLTSLTGHARHYQKRIWAGTPEPVWSENETRLGARQLVAGTASPDDLDLTGYLLTREATNQLGFRHRTLHIGELGGFPLTAIVSRPLGQTQVTLTLDGAPGSDLTLTIADLAETDPVGLVTRLENRLTRLEATKAQALADIDHASTEITHAHTDLGKPFAYADELTAARERCRDIDEQLEAAGTPPQPQNAEAGRNDPPTRRQESPVASQRIGHPATVRAADEPDIRPSWPSPTNHQAGHTRGHQPDPDASAGHRPVCRRAGLPLPQYGDAEPWRRSAPGNDHHAQDREAGQ